MDASTEVRPQPRRGLGPFTGGQLTAIVIACVVAIGFPAGAFAAIASSNVFITDRATGAHASVSRLGNLQTATIPQEGSVDAIGEALGGPGLNNACGFYHVPAGQDLIVTSIQFNSGVGTTGTGVSGVDQALFLNEDKAAACASPYNSISGGTWTTSSPQQVVLDPGFAVPPRTFLDLKIINGSSSDFAVVFVYGYLIPAPQCKSLCALSLRAQHSHDVVPFVSARLR